MPQPPKLNPGLRQHLPELVELVQALGGPRFPAYAVLAEKLGVSRSLIEAYTLAERKHRREQDAEVEPVSRQD